MKHRKQFVRIIVTIFFCTLASVSAYSQGIALLSTAETNVDPNNLVEVTDQALKVEVTALDQEYPSKNITFRLKVNSGIDSGRVFIQWYYPQSLYNIVGNSLDNVTLVSGGEFVGEKSFSPIIIPNEKTFTQGFTIGIKVTALTYEQNYLTITKSGFVIDSKYQLLPIGESYRMAKANYDTTQLLTTLVTVGVVMLISAFVIGRFVKYLNSDDTVQ